MFPWRVITCVGAARPVAEAQDVTCPTVDFASPLVQGSSIYRPAGFLFPPGVDLNGVLRDAVNSRAGINIGIGDVRRRVCVDWFRNQRGIRCYAEWVNREVFFYDIFPDIASRRTPLASRAIIRSFY